MKCWTLNLTCLLLSLAAPFSAAAQEAPVPAATNPEAESPAVESAAPSEPSDAGSAATAGAEIERVKPEDVALEQEQLSARFKHFEDILMRMAELTAPNDPRRAALLRKALAQSKDALIGTQLERLVDLLKEQRLAAAVSNQKEIRQDLGSLLELLLSEDRGKRLASEQARLRDYIKRLNRLIKEEEAIKDQTSRGAEAQGLAERQGKAADQAGGLAKDIKEHEEAAKPAGESNEGESKGESNEGEGQPPADGQGEGEGEGQKGDQPPSDREKQPGQESKPSDDDTADDDDKEKEPGDGAENGEPSEGKPSEGKPSEGKPSEGKPSEGKPSEGEPSEGKPSEGESQEGGEAQKGDQQQDDNPARKRIENAENRMRQAQQKLEKARREEAVEDQEEALRELEQAKAELEAILRQLREEQIARTLAMLEARFRKMLEMQVEVYENTLRLDRVPDDRRDQDVAIQAGRLSRKESAILVEADRALTLLREEGTAVAMPEAIEQMRDDVAQVVDYLAQVKVGEITQGVEEDIIAALEEMIAALEKAQKEMEQQQGESQPPGEPQDQPLIDALAELRMIRSLQMRVNKRTERYSKLIDGEQADDADLLEALGQLAEREAKIFRATKDIAVGKNQ